MKEEEAALNARLDEKDDGAHYKWEGFESDSFVQEVKDLVLSHFTRIASERGISLREATKATPQRWCMISGLMLAFFATLPFFIAGRWWSLFLTPQLAWVTSVNYWHDGLHFSLCTDWRINASLPYLFPWISSPYMWYHQHVIGHHAYTNIGHKDPDIAHAPQLMREHSSIRWRRLHQNQGGLARFCLIWSVAVGLGLHVVNDIRANLKLSYNNVVPYARPSRARLAAHVVGRLIHLAATSVWPFFVFPFWKALAWATFPMTSFGWSFMLNSQVNHLTEECSHASDPNFLKHQALTAQNFGVDSWWCRFYSGGLNQQIEHHMFPCVNHCHLPALAPGVRRLCEKHGVRYNEVAGYYEAVKKHVTHTTEMGKPP